MLARSAELGRPQSFTSFQSSAGEPRHRENFGAVQLGGAVSSATLYRLASVAGVGSALILLVNAAKRSTLIPTTDLTQLLAPFAEIMALGLDHGPVPCVWAARGTVRDCRVCRQLHCIGELGRRGSGDQPRILESSGGDYHRTESRAAWHISYGQLHAFSAWHARLRCLAFLGRHVPRIPLALYFIGALPIALRAFVPELALDLGLVILAAAIIWLAGWLWVRASAIDAARKARPP